MAAELLRGLLAEHLLLALIVALMLLTIFRAGPRLARLLVLAVLLAAAAALLHDCATGYAADVVPGEVAVDRDAVLARLLLVGCGLALALFWPALAELRSWLLFACTLLGALVMADAAGFAVLFLGIELLSLPAFALIVHGNGGGPGAEGAFKYLLLSAVASALLLLGISLAYAGSGTLSIAALTSLAGSGRPLDTAAVLLVASGLFLKAAVFPFHAWAPDAYGAAPLHVTALLAALVKAAVVLALARVFGAASFDAALVAVIAALAVMSIVFGNLAALAQTRLRRLLAYSSIAQAGYMIFALAGGDGRGDALLCYVAVYAGGVLLACASAAVLLRPAADDDRLGRLDGGFRARPLPALGLTAALLSLAGVPPLPGFFAKLLVFQSVIAAGQLLPAVLALAGSFIGLAVYLNVVLRLFRDDRTDRAAGAAAGPPV